VLLERREVLARNRASSIGAHEVTPLLRTVPSYSIYTPFSTLLQGAQRRWALPPAVTMKTYGISICWSNTGWHHSMLT
jgi:hypothetical protein